MAGTPGLSNYPSGPQNADISCANLEDISCVNDSRNPNLAATPTNKHIDDATSPDALTRHRSKGVSSRALFYVAEKERDLVERRAVPARPGERQGLHTDSQA